jgi:hypothetical protein
MDRRSDALKPESQEAMKLLDFQAYKRPGIPAIFSDT